MSKKVIDQFRLEPKTIADSKNVEQDQNTENLKTKKTHARYKIIAIIISAFVCIAILLLILFLIILPYVNSYKISNAEFQTDCKVSHESYDLNVTLSKLGKYKEYSVAADSEYCSFVGGDILRANGSAVDAAIATGLCNGIAHCQSSGIGGGHFMVIFLKDKNETYAIDSRETAPINSNQNMFLNKSSLAGGLSTGIPGELYGFWEAHKLGGKLPWKSLFLPSIKMCRDGFNASSALAKAIRNNEKNIRKDIGLSEIFINPETQDIIKQKEIIKMPKLARTLELISEQNIDVFYNGQLTQTIVNEINENGGIATVEDFNNYKSLVKKPIVMQLKNNYKMLTQPPPSSGILVGFIMRLMNKFDLNNETLSTIDSSALFHHRLIESFKHTFYQRSLLGDNNIENMTIVEENLLNENFLSEIRSKIDDKRTFPSSYYGSEAGKDTPGTTHISVLAYGDAVALTSTVNTYFGAKFIGKTTGIIYNNQMDDFSTPGLVNFFGLRPSVSNYIKPGKRPMSSMSPLIILDEINSVRLVLGASGGSRIITAVAQIAIENLWINPNIKECIDKKRVHHQLYPEYAEVEIGTDVEFTRALEKYGHKLQCAEASSIIQGIAKLGEDKIETNCDGRKGGIPDGA